MSSYIEKYTHLYGAWEEGADKTRPALEAKLRRLADDYHTPCCGILYFHEGCSAVWCASCQIRFFGICYEMYRDDTLCRIHVYDCADIHADIHNTGPNANGVLIEPHSRERYFKTTHARMKCQYARNHDHSILGDGGLLRWNSLVSYVLRTMLCSGDTNQRVVDELRITDPMLSRFCA